LFARQTEMFGKPKISSNVRFYVIFATAVQGFILHTGKHFFIL